MLFRSLGLQEFDALCFDVAIEDAPAALDLLAPRRECAVIVYDRPWNRSYRASSNMRRAGSWADIAMIIEGLRVRFEKVESTPELGIGSQELDVSGLKNEQGEA